MVRSPIGLPFLAPVDVTLISRSVSGQDGYGADVYAEVSTDSPGWVVWPTGLGSEKVQGQDIVTDNLTALAPPGTVLASVDRVLVGGRTYEVQGTPYAWQSPFTGRMPGVQVELRAVTG